MRRKLSKPIQSGESMRLYSVIDRYAEATIGPIVMSARPVNQGARKIAATQPWRSVIRKRRRHAGRLGRPEEPAEPAGVSWDTVATPSPPPVIGVSNAVGKRLPARQHPGRVDCQ